MRHLSYANVMASIAVFVALGGGAYATVHVNGKHIENRTISGKKLKNNTLGSKQINEGRLGQVLRAKRAKSAATAGTATAATTATTATTANTANTANTATTAGSATTATSASSAANAANATNAANAAKLGGSPPSAFLVSCPAATTLYGGVCWDNTARSAANWLVATETCGDLEGRLPTLSELVAYASQPGTQLSNIDAHWSGDVIETFGGVVVATALEGAQGSATASSGSLIYRCVFYRTN